MRDFEFHRMLGWFVLKIRGTCAQSSQENYFNVPSLTWGIRDQKWKLFASVSLSQAQGVKLRKPIFDITLEGFRVRVLTENQWDIGQSKNCSVELKSSQTGNGGTNLILKHPTCQKGVNRKSASGDGFGIDKKSPAAFQRFVALPHKTSHSTFYSWVSHIHFSHSCSTFRVD